MDEGGGGGEGRIHASTHSLTHSLALYLINSHSCFSECRQTVHATIFNDIFGGPSRRRIDSLPHLERGEEEDLKNNVTTSVLPQIPINLSFGADDSSFFFLSRLMLYLILDRSLTQFLRANSLPFVSPNRYSWSVFFRDYFCQTIAVLFAAFSCLCLCLFLRQNCGWVTKLHPPQKKKRRTLEGQHTTTTI